MKRSLSPLALVVILALLSAGCASTATPARKSFTTMSDAAEAVKTGMQIFNQRYQAGLESETHREQVLATYAIYQKAALQAVADMKAGRSVDALKLINEAALPLLNLLGMFGGTP